MRLRAALPIALGAVAVHDYYFADQRLLRNARMLGTAAQLLIDYKVFWTPETAADVHLRSAQRLFRTCAANGGLYIKLGQGAMSMNHVVPAEYRRVFASLYDQAPVVGFAAVERIFREDFGVHPSELFATFDAEPVASASIAQVHRATLKDGTAVAVKIQKPNIARQLPVDLAIYRLIVWGFEKLFDLPLYWTTDDVCATIERETDFVIEATNSKLASEQFGAGVGSRVYVPRVFDRLTSRRILTAEWIDGARLDSRELETRFGIANCVRMMVSAFAFQIFVSGHVHCDPHLGNFLFRPNPADGSLQLVILDHGMYVSESETFRQQYSAFWKALFLQDEDTIRSICREWGIGDSELFASFQLMRPYQRSRAVHATTPTKADIARMQAQMKDKVKHLLDDSRKTPRELVLIGRCMNLVRANNLELGSPVNRIGIFAEYAALGARRVGERVESESTFMSLVAVVAFRVRLLAVALVFHATQLYVSANALFGRRVAGFEQILHDHEVRTIEEQFGLEAPRLDG